MAFQSPSSGGISLSRKIDSTAAVKESGESLAHTPLLITGKSGRWSSLNERHLEGSSDLQAHAPHAGGPLVQVNK